MGKLSLKPKNYRALRSRLKRPLPLGLLLAFITAALLGYAIFSLVPFTAAEHPANLGSASLSGIKQNVLFAPVKAVQFGVLKYSENDVYIRAASALTGLVAAILLYFMLRKWYSARIALFTSLMFVCSSWFLHHGRLVNNDVMYLAVLPALMLSSMWFLSKRYDRLLPFAAILVGFALYAPGSWLFLLAGVIYFRKYIRRTSKKISLRLFLASSFLLLVTLAPLIYSFSFRQRQVIEWLGFNDSQILTPQAIGSNFLDIPRQLFLSGIDNPLFWLRGTPILDVFTTAMLILGLYAFRSGRYPAREKLVLGALVLSVILIGAGNVATISLLIPLLYIIAANGLAYMLQSWFTVFPHNPVARSIGVSMLTIAVAFSCFYQLQRYFVAWPKADATRAALKQEG